MFLKIAEGLLVALVILFVITQLLIPAYKGRRMFPFFREKEAELEDQLIQAEQKKAESEIKETIKDVQRATKVTSFNRKKQRERKWKEPQK